MVSATAFEKQKRIPSNDGTSPLPPTIKFINPLPTKKFQKNKEDFVCLHCGTAVAGTGYTNHCPNCLWSQHVDINPGDRQSDCGGMMEPIGLIIEKGETIITQRCQTCGLQKRNKAAPNDNADELVKLSAKH